MELISVRSPANEKALRIGQTTAVRLFRLCPAADIVGGVSRRAMIEATLFRAVRRISQVSDLNRVAAILGTLLVGVAAYLIVTERAERSGRRGQPPVEDLAEELKHAWEGYHNR